MKKKLTNPWLAFCIIFVIAALLSEYGYVNGSCLIFALFSGIIIYHWFTLHS
jgi:hypothetical protein